jgi:hypothetical protein
MKDYITQELEKMDRFIVATPSDVRDLRAFARANNGCNDLLLMQMAINFGYKTALENLEMELS